jgi:hypothetical protein
MIAMLDTSENLLVCAQELGCGVEQLITPLTRFNLQNDRVHFGVDNGCIQNFSEAGFMSLLAREYDHRDRCRFVCCPDVVSKDDKGHLIGDALRTLEVFDRFHPKLADWPIALVAQDGLEGLAIPWDSIVAIFIGGSTKWKDGYHAANIVKAAKILGKWVHIGRVNTPGRFEKFEALGADSMDGSGLARYSWMRERIYDAQHKPTLFNGLQHEVTLL